MGKAGWVRSRAWIWLSRRRTGRWRGQVDRRRGQQHRATCRQIGIVGELVLSAAVGLQAMGTPNTANRAFTDTRHRGHYRRRPMGRLDRRVCQRRRHNPLGYFGPHRRDARRACLVATKTINAFFHIRYGCWNVQDYSPDNRRRSGLKLLTPSYARRRSRLYHSENPHRKPVQEGLLERSCLRGAVFFLLVRLLCFASPT